MTTHGGELRPLLSGGFETRIRIDKGVRKGFHITGVAHRMRNQNPIRPTDWRSPLGIDPQAREGGRIEGCRVVESTDNVDNQTIPQERRGHRPGHPSRSDNGGHSQKEEPDAEGDDDTRHDVRAHP